MLFDHQPPTRRPLARGRGEHGYVMVMFALLLVPLLLMAGLAVDVGKWYSRSSDMRRAADAAALAGVVWLPDEVAARTAALAAAAIAAIILLTVAQLAMAHAKSDLTRAAIGIAFAAPAAIAGYHAVHGIAVATMPHSGSQLAVSLVGAAIIAAASWTHWSRARL